MYLTEQPIPVSVMIAESPPGKDGAVASFVGVVRNKHQGRSVARLYYECYPTMAEKVIGEIIGEARTKTGVTEIRVLHRIGWLEVGEVAVVIIVSSPHRSGAFTACRMVIDEIKSRVPIWKKEIYADNSSAWVLCQHTQVEVT